MSLEGILSITTKKTMTKSHQWLYEWLYSYNIFLILCEKINYNKWIAHY
jgi:hypothetical protein